jgi:hypothetical protein
MRGHPAGVADLEGVAALIDGEGGSCGGDVEPSPVNLCGLLALAPDALFVAVLGALSGSSARVASTSARSARRSALKPKRNPANPNRNAPIDRTIASQSFQPSEARRA